MDRYSSVEHFTFHGGYLEGTSYIIFPNHFNFTSSAYKELSAPIVNDGVLYFDRSSSTIPVHFKGPGSISNSGDIVPLHDAVLRYSNTHNHQGIHQPSFRNDHNLIIAEHDVLFEINIPFSNNELVNISAGTFKFTNADQLMGNFIIDGKMMVGGECSFRRGVLVEGSGDLIVLQNAKATFAGNYVLDGNLQPLASSTFEFLKDSSVRFFSSNYAEANSLVAWRSESDLLFRNFILEVDNGYFFIDVNTHWDFQASFQFYIWLSGSATFRIGPGAEELELHDVFLFDQSTLIIDRFTTLDRFLFSGGGASILNAASIYFLSGALLNYTASHDYDDRQQPTFVNQATVSVNTNDSLVEIAIPFSNFEDVLIAAGDLKLTNINELMGNYEIDGGLLVGSTAVFRRGVLITGTGDIVLLEFQHASFAGNYFLQGNLQVLEMASFEFLERADVRYFYSDYAEHGATVDWHSASRLLLQDMKVSIDHGTYTVQSGADWLPIGSFKGSLHLSGESKFHFQPSIPAVSIFNVTVADDAHLVLETGVDVNITNLVVGDSPVNQLPRIYGGDHINILNVLTWFSGRIENDILIPVNSRAIVDQFSMSRHARLGPGAEMIVDGHLFVNGRLRLFPDSKLFINSIIEATSSNPFHCYSSSELVFSQTSVFTLSSSSSSLISAHSNHLSNVFFRGSTTLFSALTIRPGVYSTIVTGSIFNVYDSFLRIDSANDPVINGTFTLFNDSFISCTNNVITFVPGSMIQGTGRLYPGEDSTIIVNGKYHASPHIYKPLGSLFFDKAFITDLSSIDATIGNLSFTSCLFGVQELDFTTISLQDVETVFYEITPVFNVVNFSIEGESVLFSKIGGSTSLSVSSMIYSGDVDFVQLPGSVTIESLSGSNSTFTLHDFDHQLIINAIVLELVAAFSLDTLATNPVLPSLYLYDNTTANISSIHTLSLPVISVSDFSSLRIDHLQKFECTNFSLDSLADARLSMIHQSFNILSLSVMDKSLLTVFDVSNVDITHFSCSGIADFDRLNGDFVSNSILNDEGSISIDTVNGSLVINSLSSSGSFSVSDISFDVAVPTLSNTGIGTMTFSSIARDFLVTNFTNNHHFTLDTVGRDFIVEDIISTVHFTLSNVDGVFSSTSVFNSDTFNVDHVFGQFSILTLESRNHFTITDLYGDVGINAITSSGRMTFNRLNSTMTVDSITSTNRFSVLNAVDFTVNSVTSSNRFTISSLSSFVTISQFDASISTSTNNRLVISDVAKDVTITNTQSSGLVDISSLDERLFLTTVVSSGTFIVSSVKDNVLINHFTSTGTSLFESIDGKFQSAFVNSSKQMDITTVKQGVIFTDFHCLNLSVSDVSQICRFDTFTSLGLVTLKDLQGPFTSQTFTSHNGELSAVSFENIVSLTVGTLNSFTIFSIVTVTDSAQITTLFSNNTFLTADVTSNFICNSVVSHDSFSINSCDSVSIVSFVQPSCSSSSEFTDINSVVLQTFLADAGTVSFAGIGTLSFTELTLAENFDCPIVLHISNMDVVDVSSLILRYPSAVYVSEVESNVLFPVIDITGKLSIQELDFQLVFIRVKLSGRAELILNSNHDVIISDYFNVHENATRSGIDHVIVTGASVFTGGSFLEGPTEFLSSLQMTSLDLKTLSNGGQIILNSDSVISDGLFMLGSTQIKPTVYLYFGDSSVLLVKEGVLLTITNAISFIQLPYSETRGSIVLEFSSELLLHYTASYEPRIFFSSTNTSLKHTSITLDGKCLSSVSEVSCIEPLFYSFDTDSTLSFNKSALITTRDSSTVFTGNYDLTANYTHEAGLLHFNESNQIDIYLITMLSGELTFSRSSSSLNVNLFHYVHSFGGQMNFESLSKLSVDDILLVGGSLSIADSKGDDDHLYFPLITIEQSSSLVLERSKSVIYSLSIIDGSFTVRSEPLVIESIFSFGNGQMCIDNTTLEIEEGSLIWFLPEGTKSVCANSYINLSGYLLLDSPSNFVGECGVIFEVSRSAAISLIQPSVWTNNCTEGAYPQLLIVSEVSTLNVTDNFDLHWNLSTVGDIVVINDAIFNVHGGGYFDSDVVICDTCSIGFYNEEYVFPPASMLRTMDNLGGTLVIGDGSAVLFEGLYLLNPDIEIGSGHLHFMKGSVFNVTSITVPSGGSLKFSQCPESGFFNLTHLHVQGEVDFDSPNCSIIIESLYVNDGLLNFGNVTGSVTIKASTIINTRITFASVSELLDFASIDVVSSTVHFGKLYEGLTTEQLIADSSTINFDLINSPSRLSNLSLVNSEVFVGQINGYLNVPSADLVNSKFEIDYISVPSPSLSPFDGGFFINSTLLLQSSLVIKTIGGNAMGGSLVAKDSNYVINAVHGNFEIDNVDLQNSHFYVDYVSGNLLLSSLYSSHGSVTIDNIGGGFNSSSIVTEHTNVLIHNITGDIYKPSFSIHGGSFVVENIDGNIETTGLCMDGDAVVLFKAITQDLTFHILEMYSGSLNFEELDGNLIILGMSLRGGELVFTNLNSPLDLTFLDVSGAKVIFNSGSLVTIQNFTIEGLSTIAGNDFINVVENFNWFGGIFTDISIHVLSSSFATIGTSFYKLMDSVDLTISSPCDFVDDCTVHFDGDSDLVLDNTSVVHFASDTEFLSVDVLNPQVKFYLLGTASLSNVNLVIEPELILDNVFTAVESSVFLRHGCRVSSKMEFFGHSRLVFQDKGNCVFYESSELIGPLTSLEGSMSLSYTSSQGRPIVQFFGLWALNTSVSIDFGYFYFREPSSFDIVSLHASSPARIYFYDNIEDEVLTWELTSVVASGSSARIYLGGLHRNVSIDYLHVHHGYIEIWVRTFISFPDFVSANGGQLYIRNTPIVWLNEIVIQSNALFRTNECENLRVGTLRSTDSRVTFQSNPDSIRITNFYATNTVINSNTNKVVYITLFVFVNSEVHGVDDFDVVTFIYESGLITIRIFADFATLSTDGLKTLGVFYRNAPCSITVRSQGHLSGGRLRGFAGSYLRVNSGASFEISTNDHLHYNYLRNTPSYNISNAPRLFVHGYVCKTSSSTMRMDFRPIVYNGGKFELQSGEVRFTAGGDVYGEFNTASSTTITLHASRTRFAREDDDRHVDFHSSSVSVIMGTVDMDMYSVWTVAGSLEITHQSFTTGSIFFLNGFSLKAGSWTCSQFCKIVAEKAIGDVSFGSLEPVIRSFCYV
ncbi:hypothetical protein GEMRC1_007936 [Eukaryota sp. GEM-RC1]